jgi:hypothetical protein
MWFAALGLSWQVDLPAIPLELAAEEAGRIGPSVLSADQAAYLKKK